MLSFFFQHFVLYFVKYIEKPPVNMGFLVNLNPHFDEGCFFMLSLITKLHQQVPYFLILHQDVFILRRNPCQRDIMIVKLGKELYKWL